MKVCFPVLTNQALDSVVYNHFGSAPVFVIVDTEDGTVNTVANSDLNHQHGACNPIMALNNSQVDAIVVGGIGGGALGKLNQKGIKVFMAKKPTIKDNMALLKESALPQFTPGHTCGGHAGCSH
jgi:predicted Fe-Mo cluster-binding NifX family protein